MKIAALEPLKLFVGLAEMVGATRESINKWLGAYEEQGLIRRERNQLITLQPEALRKRMY